MGLNPKHKGNSPPPAEQEAPFQLEALQVLFPIPLWRYRIADHEEINRLLLAEIAERREGEQPMPPIGTRLGWQSRHDFFTRDEPGHARLSKVINRIVRHALNGMTQPGAIGEGDVGIGGWVNVNPPGGYNAPHVHPSSVLSGVYYVSTPMGENPVGGAIEFNVPHPILRMSGMPVMEMLRERIQIRPEPGLLLMFPGTLSHWVHPNDSGEERVTMAFNVAVRATPRRR